MQLVSSWAEIIDFIFGITGTILSIWALKVALSDRRIDIEDFNQDNPKNKGKYDKHL